MKNDFCQGLAKTPLFKNIYNYEFATNNRTGSISTYLCELSTAPFCVPIHHSLFKTLLFNFTS